MVIPVSTNGILFKFFEPSKGFSMYDFRLLVLLADVFIVFVGSISADLRFLLTIFSSGFHFSPLDFMIIVILVPIDWKISIY